MCGVAGRSVCVWRGGGVHNDGVLLYTAMVDTYVITYKHICHHTQSHTHTHNHIHTITYTQIWCIGRS